MAAYVLFHCLGKPDPEEFEKYRAAVRPTLPHNVKICALNPTIEQVEGERLTQDLALLEFPDMAAARAWYESPQYQAAKSYRTSTGKYEAFIFEGVMRKPLSTQG